MTQAVSPKFENLSFHPPSTTQFFTIKNTFDLKDLVTQLTLEYAPLVDDEDPFKEKFKKTAVDILKQEDQSALGDETILGRHQKSLIIILVELLSKLKDSNSSRLHNHTNHHDQRLSLLTRPSNCVGRRAAVSVSASPSPSPSSSEKYNGKLFADKDLVDKICLKFVPKYRKSVCDMPYWLETNEEW